MLGVFGYNVWLVILWVALVVSCFLSFIPNYVHARINNHYDNLRTRFANSVRNFPAKLLENTAVTLFVVGLFGLPVLWWVFVIERGDAHPGNGQYWIEHQRYFWTGSIVSLLIGVFGVTCGGMVADNIRRSRDERAAAQAAREKAVQDARKAEEREDIARAEYAERQRRESQQDPQGSDLDGTRPFPMPVLPEAWAGLSHRQEPMGGMPRARFVPRKSTRYEPPNKPDENM